MRGIASRIGWCLAVGLTTLAATASSDVDGDGYVGRVDSVAFAACFGGPDGAPPTPDCLEAFDGDDDGDVDAVDFAAFAEKLGHLPVPLKDEFGQQLTADSTYPYSPRRTCGECHTHEADTVANGEWFQQGRTDLDGNVDMDDDYFEDGRSWVKSSGRYGKWGQSFQFVLAAKENTHASEIDQTTFMWVKECGECHPGGGPGERDRNDALLYDVATGSFGYELLGQTPEDVVLDGDYSVIDRETGATSLAPWDRTGLSEPDCLLCHRGKRPSVDGVDMVRVWRASVLGAGESLVDGEGDPVPAFAAAPTAGQGWFSELTATTAGQGWFSEPANTTARTGADAALLEENNPGGMTTPATTTLQIDYSVGVGNGSLVEQAGGVFLDPSSLAYPPKDKACASCHPFAVNAGMLWFDDRDIHYRKFTRLNDDDPGNDIPPEAATVCIQCHPGQVDHNAAKGNSFQLTYRDELDWVDFRSCRDCHLADSPVKHPDAPEVPGEVVVHVIDYMMEVLSCQACHIPYALTEAVMFRDITIPGSTGLTSQYLSADPLNPDNPDKSRWYPSLTWKEDSDGVERVFPANVWINVYFGDWDRAGTPEDLSDDVIAPIYTWRVASVVGPDPLPVVTDDDGDGRLEINRPEELLAYFAALEGTDPTGVQVAANPVLVRGHRVWHEDPEAPEGVSFFEHEGLGIPITSYPYIWGLHHNVLSKDESWGAYELNPAEGCPDCHVPFTLGSPVFDRLVLIDPNDPDAGALYETVREQTGLNP